MKKWIAGIASTVIGSVLIYWFTTGVKKPAPPPAPPPPIHIVIPPSPPPSAPPPARALRGYLVVSKGSRINAPEDLGTGGKLCATKKSIEDFLRLSPGMSKYNLIAVPAPELVPALEQGVCSAIFVFRREDADKLFPVGLTVERLIPVYE